MVGGVKAEPCSASSSRSRTRRSRAGAAAEVGSKDSGSEDATERRVLRSRYLAVKALISDTRDDLSRADSDKFHSIINEVEALHQQVQKPREQVADAEALLDIANSLVTSVKAHSKEGITPSDFVSSLLRNFGRQVGEGSSAEEGRSSIAWKDIGLAVAHVFRSSPGCCTMLGPMDNHLKQRKAGLHRRRVRPTESARPEELDGGATEEGTDTDKNMVTMFNILRKNKKVRLENLVLNRNSFAQTVENIFAMSFLVKDGRAEIMVNEEGLHLVSPRNAPAANAVASKEASYGHFVFRFDFRDWKLMMESVGVGEELMPHRNQQTNTIPEETQTAESLTGPSTPIRKLSRNRGLVLQEQTVVENSPESDDSAERAAAIRKGKRKIR